MGTLYYAILSSPSVQPSAAAIAAGIGFDAAGSMPVSADGEVTFPAITTLSETTDYDVYFVFEDQAGFSPVTSAVSFRTMAARAVIGVPVVVACVGSRRSMRVCPSQDRRLCGGTGIN